MNINFYLRGNSVTLRINSGKRGVSARVSTGVVCGQDMVWHPERQRFVSKGAPSTAANARITEIEGFTLKQITEGGDVHEVAAAVRQWMDSSSPRNNKRSPNSLFFLDFCDRKIEAMERGEFLSTHTSSRYSENSVKTYRAIIKTYRRFATLVGQDLDLYEVDLGGKDVGSRQEARDKSIRHWRGFADFMVREGMKPNAQESIMQIMSVFLGFAEKDLGLILERKVARAKGEEYPIVVTPTDFYKDFLSDKQSMYDSFDYTDKTRYEISALILLTTLRIGDVLKLKPENFNMNPDGSSELVVVNSKTKKRTFAIVPKKIMDIIRFNIETYGRVFTRTPNYAMADPRPMFSQYRELHVFRTVETLKPDRSGVMQKTRPLYEYLTPHALRRTAITTMLAMGVPDRQVKHMSGHTGDSKSFEKYVAFSELAQKRELSRFQDMIFNEGQ